MNKKKLVLPKLRLGVLFCGQGIQYYNQIPKVLDLPLERLKNQVKVSSLSKISLFQFLLPKQSFVLLLV